MPPPPLLLCRPRPTTTNSLHQQPSKPKKWRCTLAPSIKQPKTPDEHKNRDGDNKRRNHHTTATNRNQHRPLKHNYNPNQTSKPHPRHLQKIKQNLTTNFTSPTHQTPPRLSPSKSTDTDGQTSNTNNPKPETNHHPPPHAATKAETAMHAHS